MLHTPSGFFALSLVQLGTLLLKGQNEGIDIYSLRRFDPSQDGQILLRVAVMALLRLPFSFCLFLYFKGYNINAAPRLNCSST
jgi:hypothetical protein